MPPTSHDPIMVVLGTRPEIIKLAHIIRLLGQDATIVHTGQHYDADLSESFFDQFSLPEPAVVLDIGGKPRGQQIGATVTALDRHLAAGAPQAVIVQGDTNTALGASIAANARDIPLVHVESGLRSFDRRMPEEHNRVVVDHLADLLLAPTETNRINLENEGVAADRIVVTGNTVVEAVDELMPDAEARAGLLRDHKLEANRFVLSTLHRPENVDDPETLAVVLDQLARLPLPVVFPLHPRTAARIDRFGLTALIKDLVVIDPIGYRHFLGLGAESAFLVSDSGGVQEEVSVYKRPLLVVRRSTERPEVLGTFAELVGPGPGIAKMAMRWLDNLDDLHERLAASPSPYGDGSASQRSVAAIKELVDA